MQGINGFPKMYIHKCTTYPVCRYTDDILENDSVISVYAINEIKGVEKIRSDFGFFRNIFIGMHDC